VPRSPDKGELFECRVARLIAAEGAFVRRRINLDAQFGERFTITDVDVLSFGFSATLELRKAAGECKTTDAKNAPSIGDRLLWSAGLARIVNADRTFVAVAKGARESERNLASLVGCELLDKRDIERREAVLGIAPTDPYGPHDPRLSRFRDGAKDLAKSDEDIRRLHRFVISELWLSPPIPALKKALGAARKLGERWSLELPETEKGAVEWLFTETVLGAIVALVQLAGLGYRQPEDVLARYLHERLAEGLADYRALREISRQVDKVVTAMLPRLGVDPARSVEAIGFFEPKPPSYVEPLTELVERLARQPAATAQLARLADARYALYLGADGSVEPQLGDVRAASRLLRLVATFLRGQVRVPETLLEPLFQTSDGRGPPEEEPSNGKGSPDGAGDASHSLFEEAGRAGREHN